MKILFAALKYDYGIQERGYSFEYYSFYDTLVAMDTMSNISISIRSLSATDV